MQILIHSIAWFLFALSIAACSAASEDRSAMKDSTTGGTTLFAASASTCNPGLGSRFLGCNAFTATTPVDPVTTPAIPFLKQTPVERTYTVTFKCSSPEPVVGTLTIGGQSQKVVSSVEGLAHGIKIATKAGDAAAATLTIPKHEISVDAACKLTLLTQVALPDVSFLKAFVAQVGPYLKSFTQSYADLRVDSTSTEAAVAAKKALIVLEKRLDGQIEAWTEVRLESQPSALRLAVLCQEVRDTWRVGGAIDTDGSIPALLLVPENLHAELKECMKVNGELRAGDLRLAAAQLAQGGSVEGVLAELGKGRTLVAGDLTAVDSFLKGERSRLGARFEQIRDATESLLSSVQTWLEGAN